MSKDDDFLAYASRGLDPSEQEERPRREQPVAIQKQLAFAVLALVAIGIVTAITLIVAL